MNIPQALTSEALAAWLPAERLALVRCESILASTNLTLMEMAGTAAPDGQVVIADRQSAGRGRLGRSFSSPGGMGIYLSYLIRPGNCSGEPTQIADWVDTTCCSAVAVSDAIAEVCDVIPQIKWVNDLYLNDRKLCGILTQTDVSTDDGSIRAIIVGIGINVHEEAGDFPPELQGIATSLRLALQREISRTALAAAVIRHMDQLRRTHFSARTDYLNRFRARCPMVGRDLVIRTATGDAAVTALGISDHFGLIVRYADGREQELSSEEVIKVNMHPTSVPEVPGS